MAKGSGGAGGGSGLSGKNARIVKFLKRATLSSATRTPKYTNIRTSGGSVYKVPNKIADRYLKSALSGVKMSYGTDFQSSSSLRL